MDASSKPTGSIRSIVDKVAESIAENVWTRITARSAMMIVAALAALFAPKIWSAFDTITNFHDDHIRIAASISALSAKIDAEGREAERRQTDARRELAKDLALRDQRIDHVAENFTRVDERLRRLELLPLR